MASFTPGQAFIYHEKTMKPYEMQIAEWKTPVTFFDYTNDDELYLKMCTSEVMEKAIKVAFMNWRDKYLFKVGEEIQKLQEEAVVLREQDNFEFQFKMAVVKKKKLKAKCKRLLTKAARLKELWNISENKSQLLQDEFRETNLLIEEWIKELDLIIK